MRFDLLGAVSAPGGAVNEDRWGAQGRAAWVVDGATGIAPTRVLPGPSDASWLVDRVQAALAAEAGADTAPDALLRRIIAPIVAAFPAAALRPDATKGDLPSAGIAIARLRDGALELANLGDCRILHRRRDGAVAVFGTSRLGVLDERVRQAMRPLQAEGLAYAEVWERVLPLIRQHRALMNEAGGYWVLDLGERGIDHLEVEHHAVAPGDALLLLSDGFYRLVDIYGRYDWTGLVEAALDRGPDALLEELRAIEAADPHCRRHGRIKPRDDATAVLLAIAVD